MTKSTESTCKHCHQPIQLISTHRLDPGQWYHLDGHHAHRECRNVLAEPIEEVGSQEDLKNQVDGT